MGNPINGISTNYYINGIIWELNHDLPQQVMASNNIVYTTTESSHKQVLHVSTTLPQVLQKNSATTSQATAQC